MTQPPNELPTLITPDEMADLKALLPTPLFQQLKYLMADLLGKVERGEYEDIAKFRDILGDKVEEVGEISAKLGQMIRRLGNDKRNGYAKVRMQQGFMKRLRNQAPDTETEAITAFPIGKPKKKAVKLKPQSVIPIEVPVETSSPVIEEPIVDLQPPKIPEKVPVYEPPKSVDPINPTPQIRPVKAALPDLVEAVRIPSDLPDISERKVDVVPVKAVPEKEPKKPTPPPIQTKKPIAPKPVKKPATPPVKTKPTGKDKDRSKRVKDYIKDDQQRGSIDVQGH